MYRVSHSPPQGNGQVEDRQHHGSAVIGEQVSDDGGRDGRIAGLPDPHQASGEHKEPVVLQRERERERESKGINVYGPILYFMFTERSKDKVLIWPRPGK